MLLRREPDMDDNMLDSLSGVPEQAVRPSQSPPPSDLLDDVWGDELASEDHERVLTPYGAHAHPSDMHRLQREHSTAGYREGITVAKAQSIQEGFDEGFGLGATVGARAGQLLGLLEGVANALHLAEYKDAK